MLPRPTHPARVFFAAGLLAGTAVGAPPNPPNPPNPGPDVIVGDLPDCTNYGSYDNATYLYDLGTSSCNVGNVNLRWQAATNQHPVIAQNVYRLRNGRFEHIGMSWAKHGFYALTQSLCGTCNGQGASVLGVGCSDPYEGGTNGDQSGLGPRSAINAATGAFPFGFPNGWPPVTSGASRRLQIAASDISPPNSTGALYFGEAVYITPDDASAGNGWNNASWRPLTIDPLDTVNHTMAIAGTTRRAQPAIFAWKEADPTVRLAAFDVPADGRFWLGHTATSNGDGTWHYEYALSNLNSDRSGASFTVPFPAGTIIANAAARTIPSHSGDIYSNAPWTITTGADSITFAVPQTFAQNPSAPALRWATLANFRFDASAPPAVDDGIVTVGLFKPGGPGKPDAFSLAVHTPGAAAGPALPAPANDDCPGALALHSGENRTTNLASTDSSPAPCTPLASDAWFTYTYTSYTLPSSCPGLITFDTCGSEVPTAIAVYSSCPSAPGAETACGPCGSLAACPGPAPAAMASVPAVEGATYFIRVGSPGGPMGTRGNLVVTVTPPFCIPPDGACCASNGSCTIVTGASSCFTGAFLPASSTCAPNPCPLPPPPPNDECSGAIPIGDSTLGYPALEGTNFQADNTVNDVCDFAATGAGDVWYAYTPAVSGPVSIDTCPTPASGVALDTLLSLHAGGCSSPLLACNDDDPSGLCGASSRISTSLTAGVTYFIRVAGYGPATGDFVVRVTGGAGVVPPPPPPTGACCAGATCLVTTAALCTGPDRAFVAVDAACNAPSDSTTPCCRADFNRSNSLSVQDIFDFLNAWFAADPAADINGSGLSIADIFDFLNAWFSGC
ncbi:MAG TPA: GC-type dockerin domain-anchored protein [Phycisphaerales bacterium]|nr:GC-type dockerin domain-anchored protein [Phycisphaerales bacterium]